MKKLIPARWGIHRDKKLILFVFLAGCELVSQQTPERQAEIEKTVNAEMDTYAQMAYRREVDKYHMIKANGASRVDLCVQAGLVSALASESGDADDYRSWKRVEKKHCRF